MNVGNPINLAIWDGIFPPIKVVILGMVYYWIYHSTAIHIWSTLDGFMVAGRYLVLVRWVKLNQETHIASYS
jgi:hypothetical protein